MDKFYVIIPMVGLTQQMIDDCIQTSEDTLRKSVTQDKCVMKYSGNKPESISAYSDYTHEEILAEMSTPEWDVPDEE